MESISGTIFEFGDADLYQIFLTGNGTFSASTVEGANFDTQLFLFDANGFGIYANDDQVAGVEQQSILPANNPLTPVNPGIYYLGVTAFGNNPVSEGGLIFPTTTFFDEPNSETIAEGVNPPTGVGGNLPVIGFQSNFSSGDGSYTVKLTGVEGAEATFTEAPIPQITGDGGSITLNATNGNIRTGNLISASSFGRGGDVTINSGGSIELNGGINTFITVGTFNSPFAIAPSLDSFQIKGGTVTINAVEDIKISNEINSSATASIFLNDLENLVVSAEGGSIDVSAGGDIEASVDSSANIFVQNEVIEQPVMLKTQGGNVAFSAGANIGDNNLSTRVNSSTRIELSSEFRETIFNNPDLENLINLQSQGGKIELFAVGAISGGSFVSQTDSDLGNELKNEGGDIILNAQEAVLIFADEPFGTRINSGGVGEEGGNITIKGQSISITNTGIGGFFTRKTGNVFLLADDSISLTNTVISSDTGLFPDGIGGEIVLEASSISVSESQIGTFSEGVSGQIKIKALNDIIFSDTSVVTWSATGQSGDINFSAKNLSLLDGSELNSSTLFGTTANIVINTDSLTLSGVSKFGTSSNLSVETEGTGNAGTININTSELIVEDGGRIAASTFGQGNGGNITINASNFSLTNGGQIIANTAGEGNGGNVTINSTESVTVDGTNPSNISTDPSNISTSVEATAAGNGGEINITTPNLSLTNSGQINAISSGQGNGGDIFIDSETIILQEVASIAVNSQGSGKGGNIELQAGSLTLANQSAITAETFSTDGGNIEIALGGNLILRDNSEISASAGTDEAGGDGGNIDIDAQFILSFPDENKITAEAFLGTGGNINITTNSIFGREFLEISASSELGLEGTVSINTLELELSPGLVELPSGLETLSIPQGCEASRGRGSSFISSGRGGLPPSPTETLSSGEVWKDVQLPTQLTKNSANTLKQSNTTTERIVEATSWIINEEGIVELVAEESSDTHQGSCP